MKAIVFLMCVAAGACTVPADESKVVQALCTAEDQANGTCPETAWVVDLAVSYAASHYPETTGISYTWASCQRVNDNRVKCTVRIDLPGGAYVQTTCTNNELCWGTRSPGSFGPGPETSVCTEEDQQNGTCGDPGGGSPPDVPAATESYADAVSASYTTAGYQLLGRTQRECYRSSLNGGRVTCIVTLDFGSFHLTAWCVEPAEGDVQCDSTTTQGPAN